MEGRGVLLDRLKFKLVYRCEVVDPEMHACSLECVKWRPFSDHLESVKYSFFATCSRKYVYIYAVSSIGLKLVAEFSTMMVDKIFDEEESYYSLCWAASKSVSGIESYECLCVAGRAGFIHIIDFQTLEYRKSIVGHVGPIYGLATHPTRMELVASCSMDESVRIWNVQNSECLIIYGGLIGGHLNAVVSVSWNEDGTSLVTHGRDKLVKIWNVNLEQNKKNGGQIKGRENSCGNDSNQSSKVAFTFQNRHGVEHGVRIQLLPTHTCHWEDSENGYTLFFRRELATWLDNGELIVWDTFHSDDGCFSPDGGEKGNYKQYLKLASFKPRGKRTTQTKFSIARNGSFFAAGTEDGQIVLMDIWRRKLKLPNPYGYKFDVLATDISADVEYIVCSGETGELILFSTEIVE